MAEMTPERNAAQKDAVQRTNWEHQRIDYYRGLRFNFIPFDVDSWLETLYNQQKEEYKPQKLPSKYKVRKEAGIGFFENLFADEEKKKTFDARKAKVREQLQEKVERANNVEFERCSDHNRILSKRLNNKSRRLSAHDPEVVEEYFTFALSLDSFSLNGDKYHLDYSLKYDAEDKQLVIDYKLPEMDEVSRIKEWKVDKNNNVVSKEMNKSDYLEMYEAILFDLSMRTVGVLFESDSNNVIDSIVFNGSCIYNAWQSMPTILISFLILKNQYSFERIKRMECISKAEVAKLNEVRYLGDIHSKKAPSDLWEAPPIKNVIPIRTSSR